MRRPLDVADEGEHRGAHVALVGRLVRLEPVAIVVARELAQTMEQRVLKWPWPDFTALARPALSAGELGRA